jgi:hypothetical protein
MLQSRSNPASLCLCSCADLSRFGWLWLNNGTWNGHTVFTRDFWNKALSQPQYPFGPARRYGVS